MVTRSRSTLAGAAIQQATRLSTVPRCAAHLSNVDKKLLQSDKIRQIGEALMRSGLVTLDQQADALGLSRSTAWTILNPKYKGSGLSAIVINQMLIAPRLPPLVRAQLFEYIEEKIAGSYGHGPQQVRRFAARLTAERLRYGREIAKERYAAKPEDSEVRSSGQTSRDLLELPKVRFGLRPVRQYALRRPS
jgi:hypothetical protein